MKLCNLIIDGEVTLGAIVNRRPVNLVSTAVRLGIETTGNALEDLLPDWPRSFEAVEVLIEKASQSGDLVLLDEDPVYAAPVRRPGTFRDGYAFETHVRNVRKLRGLDVAEEWYQFPVFYFSNPNTILGSDAEVRFPRKSKRWDYELEVGAILGGEGSNLNPDEAEKLIAGYTIMNDWSARDLQRTEMVMSLGPAKGKDFATSIGPWLVTPDEIESRRKNKGYNIRMIARKNGETTSDGNWSTIHFSFGEIIARASEDATVYPGDLFGSGTVGYGCFLERGLNHDMWFKTGDEMELEIEEMGILANKLV